MTKVKEAFLYDFFSQAELEFLMALPKDEEIQHDFSNAFEEKMKNVMMRREKKSFFSFCSLSRRKLCFGRDSSLLIDFSKRNRGCRSKYFSKIYGGPDFCDEKA